MDRGFQELTSSIEGMRGAGLDMSPGAFGGDEDASEVEVEAGVKVGVDS